jgi:hypothetical protein
MQERSNNLGIRLTLQLITSTIAVFIAITALTTKAHATDSIGTASGTVKTCLSGGASGGKCWAVTIDCPGTPTFYAAAKLNTPSSGTPIGAVVLTTGGGGDNWYDLNFQEPGQCNGNCGLQTITDLNNAGYDTFQTNFSDVFQISTDNEFDGWLTGSLTSTIGPRVLACRYATMVHWIWATILGGGTVRPVCATGNSAGSAALGYALAQYDLGLSTGPGPVLKLAELTSGPPLSRMDLGCLGTNAPVKSVSCPPGAMDSENISIGDAGKFIDPSYDGETDCTGNTCTPDSSDPCGWSIHNGVIESPLLAQDSILSTTDTPILGYTTFVRMLFGYADRSAAVPLGSEYYNAVTTSKAMACVGGTSDLVGHGLPGWASGEAQIVSDIKIKCK